MEATNRAILITRYIRLHKCRVEHFPMITSDQPAFGSTHSTLRFEKTPMAFRSQSAQSALSSLAFAFLTIAAGTARAGLTLGAYHYHLLSKAIHIRVSIRVILNLKNPKLFRGASCASLIFKHPCNSCATFSGTCVRCHHN